MYVVAEKYLFGNQVDQILERLHTRINSFFQEFEQDQDGEHFHSYFFKMAEGLYEHFSLTNEERHPLIEQLLWKVCSYTSDQRFSSMYSAFVNTAKHLPEFGQDMFLYMIEQQVTGVRAVSNFH